MFSIERLKPSRGSRAPVFEYFGNVNPERRISGASTKLERYVLLRDKTVLKTAEIPMCPTRARASFGMLLAMSCGLNRQAPVTDDSLPDRHDAVAIP